MYRLSLRLTACVAGPGFLFYLLLFLYLTPYAVAEPPQPGGTIHSHQIQVDGHPRDFAVYIPQSAHPASPLLFVLHGSGGSGAGIRASSAHDFDREADRHGFMVIYPDGYDRHWNDCRKNASYTANTEDIDDITFFRSMVRFVTSTYGTSPAKIYAIGHSNGGHMAYKLGLEAPDLMNGIIAVSASLPIDANSDCSERRLPVDVVIMNGTLDNINPYAGGLVEVAGDRSRGIVRSTEDTALYWAKLAGAEQSPATRLLPERDGNTKTSITVTTWTGQTHAVELYTLTGSGHVIPSYFAQFPARIGPLARDASAAEVAAAKLLADEIVGDNSG